MSKKMEKSGKMEEIGEIKESGIYNLVKEF